MPRVFLPQDSANYTMIHRIFQEQGHRFPLDASHAGEKSLERIPFDTEITIYNRTKVR